MSQFLQIQLMAMTPTTSVAGATVKIMRLLTYGIQLQLQENMERKVFLFFIMIVRIKT